MFFSIKRKPWEIYEKIPGGLKVALALMALVLLVGGAWFYQVQSHYLRREAYNDLTAIAQLKVNQITQWRAERFGDAAVLMERPFFAEVVASFMKNPQAADTEKMLASFRSLQKHYHYHDVLLVDAAGKVRLSLNGHLAPLREIARQALTAAFRERKTVMTDLYVLPGEDDPHHDVVAPFFVGNGGSGSPIGAILLQCDVRQFLYPLIQSWPLPSRTAETLLVRRDGEAVLFLNELRHQKGTAFKLRIPLSRKDLPAVMAVLGQQGVVAGKDYRGKEVLSALKAVPDTPWFMVAKIDASEALSVMRRESVFILVLFFGLFVVGAASMGMVWQRNEKVLYRSLLETETARRKSEERYRITLMSVGDGVMASDVSGRVELLNPVAEALTGWQQAEAFGKPVEEVFRIINEETRRSVENPVSRVLREGKVAGLANHTVLIARDGSEHPITDSGAPIQDEKGAITGVVLVFRDQTAERETERTLRESEERFRLLIEQAPEAIAVFDVEEDRFVDANIKAEKLFGCSHQELLKHGPQHFYATIQPNGRPITESVKENIERILAGEEIMIERLIRNVEGKDLICEVRLVRLPSKDRRLIRNSYIDITERKQTEEQIRLNTSRLQSLVSILQYQSGSLQDFLDYALDETIKLTGSKIGYIYHYHEDRKEFVLNTWSKEVMNECSIEEPQTCYELDKTGIWGEAVRQRKEIIVNDFQSAHPLKKGYPEGHAKLYKYMTVPVFSSDKIVAVVGVANKATDYTETDVMQLTILRDVIWKVVEQRKADEELQALSSRQEALLSAIPDIIMEVDSNKVYTWANQAGTEFFGEDVIGKEAAFYFEGDQDTYQTVEPLFSGNENVIYVESAQQRKDGQKRLLAWWCRVLKDASGNVIGGLSSARDITERKQAEEQVRASLREKEFMLREIHHRVKNNLAVIQSLLNLQAGKIKDPQALKAFKESRDRIRSMALVHEKLYRSPDLSHIVMADYLRDLSTRLFHSSQVSPNKVKLKLEVEEVQVGIDKAIPLGLILNELISNALNHAFPGGREGEIRVRLAQVDGGMIRLTVENNGIGFPEEVDFHKAESMGFQVVTALVEQLGGTIELHREVGTEFRITFPEGKK